MRTIYLKAATEQELIDALPDFRGINEEGNQGWLPCSHKYSLDVIGTLCKEDGAQIEGFHANLKCTDDIASQIPENVIIPTPNNILRKFFGD